MASPFATAFVRIRGQDGGLAADISRMAGPAAASAGQDAGSRFSDRFRDSLKQQSRRTGEQAADDFADGFSRDVNGNLRDVHGRFTAEGRRSGTGFLSGFRSGSGGGSSRGGLVGEILGSLRGAAGPIAAATAALGITKIGSDAVSVEAQFSKTMRTMAAVAGVPAPQIAQLSDLAKQMGADTSFSANEAADAMLELAKGGLSAATIQSGALQGTLTLAAAGGTDLGTAATIASNALNTFGLAGKDMGAIAAALAGGANASTASVESLGEALSQVGPGAKNAGLSLNDTVGVLSAFDAAGIKGSDAGTSLKTMLVSLVPQSESAADAMSDLGLKFTDAQGQFLPIADVAQQLQAKLGGLSQEAKTLALSKIFGSDASRAASVLADLGSKGLTPFIAATKDAGAAQAAAQAAMGGTSGALERLQGAVETAKLRLGEFLAPAVVAGADLLTSALDRVGPAIGGVQAAAQLLFRGDFTPDIGKALGVEEDSPVVGVLLSVRDAVREVAAAGQLLFTGDFTGGIGKALGVEEDDALVDRILTVRDTVIGTVRGVQAFLTGGSAADIAKAFGLDRGNELIGSLVSLRGSFITFAGTVRTIFGQVGASVRAGLGPVAPYVRQAFGAAQQIVGNVMGIIAVFVRQGVTTVQQLWRLFGPTILASIGPAMRAVAQIISGVMQVIAGITRTVLALLRGDWAGAAAGIRQIVTGLGNLIVGSWRSANTTMRALTSAAVAAVKALFADMASGVKSRISAAVAEVRGFGSKARSAVGDLGGLLVNAGRSLINGLISGIEDRLGALQSKVAGVAGTIRDYFPFSPAKKGPLRRYPMERAGRNIVTGLAAGMAAGEAANAAVLSLADRMTIPNINKRARRASIGGKLNALRLAREDMVALARLIAEAVGSGDERPLVLNSDLLAGAVDRSLGGLYR